jgi:hypothetical protein
MVAELTSDRVSLRLLEHGGFLDDVVFDGRFAPLHRAPWVDTPDEHGLPHMLQNLRGDFFCAPFGASDQDPGEDRPHGASSNDIWIPENITKTAGHWILRPAVSGAVLHKIITLKAGHPVVYQSHIFEGGSGSIPVAHHLMLKADNPLHLSFSAYKYIATPPGPVEPDPEMGRSLLAYNEQFRRLEQAPLADGRVADLSVYPALDGHEDLLMLSTAAGVRPAWSAAVCPEEQWVWFAVKDPSVLPSTTLWMSNGGRYYPPFSGRHRRVIGIEECRSCFHLGHRASAGKNPVSDAGIATSLNLQGGRIAVNYAFGVTGSPQGLQKVESVTFQDGQLLIEGNGVSVDVPFDTGFFSST